MAIPIYIRPAIPHLLHCFYHSFLQVHSNHQMRFAANWIWLTVVASAAGSWVIPWEDILQDFQSPAIHHRPWWQQRPSGGSQGRPSGSQQTPPGSEQRPSASQTCECGWVNRARIVDGKETGENEYPPMVALLLTGANIQFCGGTILTPWHVVTAAHCTDGKSPRQIVITVGAHNLKRRESRRNVHRLSAIVQHEQYDPRTINNDIALLVTEQPITFNRFVGPACLPRSRMNLEKEVVKALGWGHTQNKGVSSDVLQEVDLRVISMTNCRRMWRAMGQSGLTLPQRSINICTDHPTKDTCQGDSGGPLIWLEPKSNRYAIVALVSYGSDCGGSLPGVNTDVSAFLPWITSNIQATKRGVTPCSLAQ